MSLCSRSERGIALIAVTMAMMLLMAVGAALILSSSTEMRVAANFRAGSQAFYAADAIVERTIGELRGVADWNLVLSGAQQSSLVDGAPSGIRRLSDGSVIDLDRITSMANCRKVTPCSDADMSAATADRPWGANNPRWRVYAFGRLADAVSPAATDSPFYVVALVADDSAENDANPAQDGGGPADPPNPGRGVIVVRGEAFGPRRAHRVVEAAIARFDTVDPATGSAVSGLRVLAWREGG